jgi:hypothetical protein
VQELNFPELTAEEVHLKNKTFRTRGAAEQTKSQKYVATYMKLTYRNIFGSNKHTYSCVAFKFHEPQCQQRLLLQYFFLHSLIKQSQKTDT